MRRRALLVSLFALLIPLLAACDSTGLPAARTPRPTSQVANPTSTSEVAFGPTPTTPGLVEPTSTTEVAQSQPTPTEATVAQAPTDTVLPSGGTPEPQGSPVSQANQQLLAQIEADAAKVRGLQPLKDVPAEFLSEDQLRANLTKDMQDNYSKTQGQQDAKNLWLLRLINDPTLDLYQFEIDLQTEQVAGYYDPKKKDLFVRNDGEKLSPLAQQTLAHEFTHALQDQHYDIEHILPDKNTDDDRDLGTRSLVEGDATISGLEYAQTYMSQQDYQTMLDESKNAPSSVLDNAPRYLKDSLYFPYDQGVSFVIALGILKGFAPINKALQDPPVSSEQIIHPEKYMSTPRDMPKPVALTPLTDTLGAGWTMPENGTLGEFDFQVMLEESQISKDEADNAAAGWGGAVYNYYENGDKWLSVFNSVWDTKTDANEFETAVNDSLKQYKQSGGVWTDGKRFWAVKRTGDAIAVGASTDQLTLAKAMSALK